jgi:hypothetical protein
MIDESIPLKHGFISKHWNGEYSLSRAFWVNFILVSWLPPLFALATQGLFAPAFNSRLASALYLLAAIVSIVFIAWGGGGTLKSARRYVEIGGPKRWSTAATIVTILILVETIVPIVRSPTLLYANARMILTGQYASAALISLTNRNTAVLIEGSLQHGTAASLSAVLEKTPEVSTVLLNSSGGLFTEAVLMAKSISERHLDTYVQRECSSACTLVFLAGALRCLSPAATLGFHNASRINAAPGVDSANIEAYERGHYSAAGLPAEFVDSILATSNTSLWRPTRAQLLEAHVITPDCPSG